MYTEYLHLWITKLNVSWKYVQYKVPQILKTYDRLGPPIYSVKDNFQRDQPIFD